jgi:hypothetical protein
MRKIKFTLVVGLVFLMVAMFVGCEPSLGGAKEPDRYFTLQLLDPETDRVVHTCNLTLSIPNYHYANMLYDPGILEYTSLKYRTSIHRYEPSGDPTTWNTFGTDFFPILVSDYLAYSDDTLVPTDLTLVGFAIFDFEGTGTYVFSEDDIEGYLLTDQLDSEGTQYLIESIDSATIEIVEYGEVGGFVRGNAFINNAVLYNVNSEEETITFDINADFSFERDNDLIVKMRKITYMRDTENKDLDYYYPVGMRVSLSDSPKTAGDAPVSGWSTQPHGEGTTYDSDSNCLTMPDEDLTLYAILPD